MKTRSSRFYRMHTVTTMGSNVWKNVYASNIRFQIYKHDYPDWCVIASVVMPTYTKSRIHLFVSKQAG